MKIGYWDLELKNSQNRTDETSVLLTKIGGESCLFIICDAMSVVTD